MYPLTLYVNHFILIGNLTQHVNKFWTKIPFNFIALLHCYYHFIPLNYSDKSSLFPNIIFKALYPIISLASLLKIS